MVVLLQIHIHNQRVPFLLYGVALLKIGVVSCLVIHFYILHQVSRQVAQGHIGIAAEKVLAVNQQTADKLSVDIDAAIVLQLCARQLLDELVKQ